MGEPTLASRLDRVAFWVSLACIAVGVLLLAAHTIHNVNITWDEAGQYWMTQGQAFGHPWGTPPGTLAEGLDLGRNGNILDPVGFTIILWGWIHFFGSDPATLRALSFLFFIGTLLSGYLLGRRSMGQYRTLSLLLPAAVLTTQVSLQWATEVRPYSAELMGVVAGAALGIWYLRRPSWLAMLSLSAVLAVFCVASRYAFALAAGSVMVTVLLVMWRSGRVRSHWPQIATGFGVLAVVAVFLLWNMGHFDSADQVWDSYGVSIRVESLTDFLHMRMLLQINFFYGWHKLTGLFLLVGLAAWLVSRFARSESGAGRLGRELRDSAADWLPAWVFVGVYEVACATANQMGWTGWNSEFRHSIGLLGAAIVSGLGLAALGRSVLHAVAGPPKPRVGTLGWVGFALWAVVLVALLSVTLRTYSGFQRTNEETLGETIPTRAAAAIAGEESVRWLVDTQLYASLRYLAEASEVNLGGLEITSAVPFGLYGHTDEQLTSRMIEAQPCKPGITTVMLLAGSLDANQEIYSTVAEDVSAQGCTLTSVPLSEKESLVLVR